MEEYNITPRIKRLEETLLIGQHKIMSIANDRTLELWKEFMPRLHEIRKLASPDLYSVEVYPDTAYFTHFHPNNEFVKWAAASVRDTDEIPEGMDSLVVVEGDYAVFRYIGRASNAGNFYQYIYGEWLAKSGYKLDDRPHFAVMGDKYTGDTDDSEEEIWVPVKTLTS